MRQSRISARGSPAGRGHINNSLLLAGSAAAWMLLAVSCGSAGGILEREASVTVDESSTSISRLTNGITHTRQSPDGWNQRESVDRARGLIRSTGLVQNQYIMGFGAGNPEPAPGQFDFKSLDARMELIAGTSGLPVITLCCAPDWMKGGAWGQTDWSTLEQPPLPEHYADFAALAEAVARRYRWVKHYQVWHPLNGFYDRARNNWDERGYTRLYNHVYTRLKAVDPRIKVGGPSVPLDGWSSPARTSHPSALKGDWGVMDRRSLDALAWWLKHKEGADFISVDLSLGHKDRSPGSPTGTIGKIPAAVNWIRKRSPLPIWISRWDSAGAGGQSLPEQNAAVTAAVAEMVRSGVDVQLLWGPEESEGACQACLWTDTRVAGGGLPTPLFSAISRLAEQFPAGTRLLEAKTTSEDVIVLASPDHIMLINGMGEPLHVAVDSERHLLQPYEIKTVDRQSG